MKLRLMMLCLCLGTICKAQHVYNMKADSVRIYSDCDTAELVIRNHTKDTLSYLYNKGNGRTEFRRIRMDQMNDGRIAITGGDTATITLPPALKPVYLMTEDVCQTWNGAYTVMKNVTGNLYLKLDSPANLVNGKELFLSNQSDFADYYTGGINFYSYSAKIWTENGPVDALKIRWAASSGVHLIYDAATNMFYLMNAHGGIEPSTNGPCPQ